MGLTDYKKDGKIMLNNILQLISKFEEKHNCCVEEIDIDNIQCCDGKKKCSGIFMNTKYYKKKDKSS